MSDYTKLTNFAVKDGYTTGNPAKVIKGTEIDDEFNAISTAIGTKLDISAIASTVLSAAYPIGSIYVNATNSANPSSLLGFGTWVAFGAGRVPVGFDASNPLFDSAEETGGSADAIVVSHTHTASVTDSGHDHDYYRGNVNVATTPGGAFLVCTSGETLTPTSTETTGISVTNASAGSSGTNANYQPYITVYMWKRTA